MCWTHDIDIINVNHTHLGAGAHDVVSNGVQHHAPADDTDIFISLMFILLCYLA